METLWKTFPLVAPPRDNVNFSLRGSKLLSLPNIINKTRSTQQEPQNNISLPNSWPRQSRSVKKNNLNAAILFRLILIPLATAWPFLENNQTCSNQEFKNGGNDI